MQSSITTIRSLTILVFALLLAVAAPSHSGGEPREFLAVQNFGSAELICEGDREFTLSLDSGNRPIAAVRDDWVGTISWNQFVDSRDTNLPAVIDPISGVFEVSDSRIGGEIPFVLVGVNLEGSQVTLRLRVLDTFPKWHTMRSGPVAWASPSQCAFSVGAGIILIRFRSAKLESALYRN